MQSLNGTRILLLLSAVLVLTAVGPVHGTETETSQFHRVEVSYPDTVYIRHGDTVTFPLYVSVKDGWHINAHDPIQDYLVPTRVRFEHDFLTLENVLYPAGQAYNFSFSETRVLVYSGTLAFPVTVGLPTGSGSNANTLRPGEHGVEFSFRYQACSDKKCARPETGRFTVDFDVHAPPDSSNDTGVFQAAAGGRNGAGNANRIGEAFREYGLILGLGFIFFLGLMLNLTPCVYPMIPITVGFFGSRGGGRYTKRILDALMFILGMALIYSIFGTLAGMTDNVLGQALQQPFMLIVLSGIMMLLAASMFGLYELRMPSAVRRGSETISRGLGTFGMGMTLGVAAAPCLAPATVTLLAYISQQQSAYVGGLLFFVLSLGLGFPYLFLAVFASSLSDLPGSGTWLKWINKLIGFMILAVAVYFLWPLLPLKTFGYLLIALVVVGGLVLAVMHPPASSTYYYARAAGLAVLVVLFVFYADRTFLVAYEGVDWIPGKEVIGTSHSGRIDQPALVYVSADWCAPCKEMELRTFPNNTLRRELKTIAPIKIDLTSTPPEAVGEWLTDHNVNGVPTMIFLKPSGREITSLRTVGFVGPSVLTSKIRILKRRSDAFR